MIVKCEKCQARFRMNDDKVSDVGVRVRCSKCQHTFKVRRDGGDGNAELTSDSSPVSSPASAPRTLAKPAPVAAAGLAPSPSPEDEDDVFANKTRLAPLTGAMLDILAKAKAKNGEGSAPRPGAFPAAKPVEESVRLDDISQLSSEPFDPFAHEARQPPAVARFGTPAPSPPSGGFDPFGSSEQDLSSFGEGHSDDSARAPPAPGEFDPFEEAASASPEPSPGAIASAGADIELEDPFAVEPSDPFAPSETEPSFQEVPSEELAKARQEEAPNPLEAANPFEAGLAEDTSSGPDPFSQLEPSEAASPASLLPDLPPPEPTLAKVPTSAAVTAVSQSPANPAAAPPVVGNREDRAAAAGDMPWRSQAFGKPALFVSLAVLATTLFLAGGAALVYGNDGKLSGFLGPTVAVETVPVSLTLLPVDISNGLYETKTGRPIFYVRGVIENRGTTETRARVRAELLEGSQLVSAAEAFAGKLSPEELHGLTAAAELDALLTRMEAAAPTLAPGQKVDFVVPFYEYPPDLSQFRLRVTAREVKRTSASVQ